MSLLRKRRDPQGFENVSSTSKDQSTESRYPFDTIFSESREEDEETRKVFKQILGDNLTQTYDEFLKDLRKKFNDKVPMLPEDKNHGWRPTPFPIGYRNSMRVFMLVRESLFVLYKYTSHHSGNTRFKMIEWSTKEDGIDYQEHPTVDSAVKCFVDGPPGKETYLADIVGFFLMPLGINKETNEIFGTTFAL